MIEASLLGILGQVVTVRKVLALLAACFSFCNSIQYMQSEVQYFRVSCNSIPNIYICVHQCAMGQSPVQLDTIYTYIDTCMSEAQCVYRVWSNLVQ